MNVRHLLLIFLISLNLSLYAKVSVEADVSVFFPISSNLRTIYGAAWPDLALSLDHISLIRKFPSINLFAIVNYQFASGHSEHGDESTHINLVPITLGLKWVKKIHKRVEWYFGAAPKYYFMHITNNSPYVPRVTHQNGCGAFVTTGTFLYPKNHLVLDFFLNFSYMKFGAPHQPSNAVSFSTNVAGLDLGAGVGWDF